MLILLTAMLALATPGGTQGPLPGTWEGSVELPTGPLKIAVVFRAEADSLAGRIDIPQQGAAGLPLRAVTVKGSDVRFELPTGGAVAIFEGRIEGERIAGTFTQGPFSGPFAVTPACASRPILVPCVPTTGLTAAAWALHETVAAKLETRPELVDVARANLARWISRSPHGALLELLRPLFEASIFRAVLGGIFRQ